jgi:hypothetical protein
MLFDSMQVNTYNKNRQGEMLFFATVCIEKRGKETVLSSVVSPYIVC